MSLSFERVARVERSEVLAGSAAGRPRAASASRRGRARGAAPREGLLFAAGRVVERASRSLRFRRSSLLEHRLEALQRRAVAPCAAATVGDEFGPQHVREVARDEHVQQELGRDGHFLVRPAVAVDGAARAARRRACARPRGRGRATGLGVTPRQARAAQIWRSTRGTAAKRRAGRTRRGRSAGRPSRAPALRRSGWAWAYSSATFVP